MCKFHKMWYISAAVVLCMGCLATNAYAEDSSYLDDVTDSSQGTVQNATTPSVSDEAYLPVVTSVDVQGNRIISSATIYNKIRTQKGADLSREVINEDIKRLYATGYFQDVQFDLAPDGNNYKVLVVVEEKPIIASIQFKGNVVFDEDALQKVLGVNAGSVLDYHALNQGCRSIQDKYAAKGFKFVSVEPKIDVNQATKEATVRVMIDEGKKYKIESIFVDGAEEFKPKKIKRLMRTKQDSFWLFWRTGAFKEDYFRVDLERIMFMYQSKGYLDATVTPDFTYDDEKRRMDIKLAINEGVQYRAGKIMISGNALFPESEIWGQLQMLPGEIFSELSHHHDIMNIKNFYADRGYIESRIIPRTSLNRSTGKVDVSYEITEGDLYFIDKVKIRGNTKTKDIVIRRELRAYPGEQYDGEKVRYSKQRLDNLGFFEEVSYDTEPGSAPNKRDLIINVKEKQTGELSFGAGISSIDSFLGFAEIAQRNFDLFNWPTFTGAGQNLSVSARMGSTTQDFDFNFTEPYLFNKNLSMSFDVFHTAYQANNVDYDTKRLGAGVTFGHRFTDQITGSMGYRLEQIKMEDISSDAGADVLKSDDNPIISRITSSITRDTRDNVFSPRKGSIMNFSAEMAGGMVGGDYDFYSLNGRATKYFSFGSNNNHVIELRGRFGVMDSMFGSDFVPVYERYYAGGYGTVRGFGYRRVGPLQGGDAVGGQTMLVGSIEYVFPLTEGITGAFFIDAGHVNADSYKFGADEFGVSIGPGIRIKTPIGPITLYYGFPIVNADEQYENGRFEFNLSRGF